MDKKKHKRFSFKERLIRLTRESSALQQLKRYKLFNHEGVKRTYVYLHGV